MTSVMPDVSRLPAPAPDVSLLCTADPELWFADSPSDLEEAKARCGGCPIRVSCLASALERSEPWGVWGGQLVVRGRVVARKRPRGRPPKNDPLVA